MTPTGRQAALVREFKDALEAQDIEALVGLLDPQVTAIADGSGLVTAQLHPIQGSVQVAETVLDIARTAPTLTILERAGQRVPRSRVRAGWRGRDRDGVRHRERPHQAHLGRSEPEKLRPWTPPESAHSPVWPSMASRMRSAWPLCRAYSSIM